MKISKKIDKEYIMKRAYSPSFDNQVVNGLSLFLPQQNLYKHQGHTEDQISFDDLKKHSSI